MTSRNKANDYEQPDFCRASGDCLCPDCGKEYWHHPQAKEFLSWDGYPFLHRLCNGKLVKL